MATSQLTGGDKYGYALRIVPWTSSQQSVRLVIVEGVGSALLPVGLEECKQTFGFIADHITDNKQGVLDEALCDSARKGYSNVLQLLLDKGANVNAPGIGLGSPLQLASRYGHEKVVQMLLDKGADVNLPGRNYGDALHVALFSGNKKIVQMLLDRGTDVNAQGGEFSTALVLASYLGDEMVVQMLLEKGADVDIRGKYYDRRAGKMVERNALQTASAHGHKKIEQMLLQYGAKRGRWGLFK